MMKCCCGSNKSCDVDAQDLLLTAEVVRSFHTAPTNTNVVVGRQRFDGQGTVTLMLVFVGAA